MFMHVAIISQLFPPDIGGGATRAQNVALGLLEAGCSVTIISAFPHYPYGNIPKKYRWKPLILEYKNGMKLIRTFVPALPSKGKMNRFILFAFFLVSSLFSFPLIGKIDVIWAANPNVLAVFPALIFKFLKKVPVAQNVDDLWPEDFSNFNLVKEGSSLYKISRLLARISYLSSDIITPISPGYVESISKNHGIPKNKIFVVKSGVDTKLFKGIKENRQSFISKKEFVVFYIGAFSIAYDFDQIFQAAKELKNQGIRFIIQGGGELIENMKKKVEDMRLDNVKILEKLVNRKEVAKLLCKSDALILPLRDIGKPYLGISSKLYEYQCAQKPILCCADGQPANYIKETRSGIVIKPGDYKSLVQAILILKKNPNLSKQLGLSGKNFVEKNLSIEKIGLIMKEKFEKLLIKENNKANLFKEEPDIGFQK
jgi:glycosyltransferase involved in cell wall biosynthesis